MSTDATEAPHFTPLEQRFIDEAYAGHFGLLLPPDYPLSAMGAVRAGNLFSMRVIEEPDVGNGGSLYRLPGEDE